MSEMPRQPDPGVALDKCEDDFFAKVGPVPAKWDEARRYPRYYYRNRVPATVHPSDGAAGEVAHQCFVLTRDLSRSGMSLLHNGQLFPGQRIDVVLPGDVLRHLEVMWCKRIANRCYSAGCRFVKSERTAGRPESPAEPDSAGA